MVEDNNPKTPTILKEILERKAQEVIERRAYKNRYDLEQLFEMHEAPRGFEQRIAHQVTSGMPAVIAEVKKASPSKGVIRANFSPRAISMSYYEAGACCLSVLTDRDFFQGHEDYLTESRLTIPLPVLRKDFIIDPYQITESRAIGADCILLIAAALDAHQLKDFRAQALEYGMDVLIEVHTIEEMERALSLDHRLIGVNNRNLHTFEVSLKTTLLLKEYAEEMGIHLPLLVTESGVSTIDEVALMKSHHVNVFLIGEAFMSAADPGEKLTQLFGEL